MCGLSAEPKNGGIAVTLASASVAAMCFTAGSGTKVAGSDCFSDLVSQEAISLSMVLVSVTYSKSEPKLVSGRTAAKHVGEHACALQGPSVHRVLLRHVIAFRMYI